MSDFNEQEKKLENKIYEILFKLNPLGFEDDHQKKTIYSGFAPIFMKKLKSAENANKLRDDIYNFIYAGAFAEQGSFQSLGISEEATLDEKTRKEYHNETIKFIGVKENYIELAEKIFVLKK